VAPADIGLGGLIGGRFSPSRFLSSPVRTARAQRNYPSRPPPGSCAASSSGPWTTTAMPVGMWVIGGPPILRSC